MNTHDIELPPLPPCLLSLDNLFPGDSGRILDYARAAIEADRKRRGKPVAMVKHFYYQGIARGGLAQEAVMLDGVPTLPDGAMLYADPRSAEPVRGEPVLVGWAVSTTGKGMLPASRYTEFEARRAGYSLPVYRLAASQPAEPGSTHHVHRGTESLPCYCNGTYDHPIGKETLEPVKVPSDSAIMFEWSQTPNTGDMRVDLIAFARALLARYGQAAQPAPEPPRSD